MRKQANPGYLLRLDNTKRYFRPCVRWRTEHPRNDHENGKAVHPGQVDCSGIA